MAKDYVQKYLWRDYGKPFHTAWQITLTADEAVAFLAAVCILITYTQAKTWRLARQAVIRVARPIQLPLDGDDPSSLLRLSQYDAMSRLLSGLSPWRHRRNPRPPNGMTTTSPLFGVAAIVNAALFAVMGVLIPWLLTGGLQTPVVQSRLWEGCGLEDNRTGAYWHSDASRNTRDFNLHVSIEKYRQCWQSSLDASPTSCTPVDGTILDRPQVGITSKPDGCPFAQQKCLGRLLKFQLEHENLTLRDYGLNVKSALRHSRRLTCTRLDLEVSVVEDHFMERKEGESKQDQALVGNVGRSIINRSDHAPNLTIHLLIGVTGVGRPKCGNCDVLRGYLQEENWDTFFVVFDRAANLSNTPSHRHGQIFVVIGHYRGHFTTYPYDLDSRGDAANNDYAVAMCQEQHRLCLDTTSPARCTRFGDSFGVGFDMESLHDDNNLTTPREVFAFRDVFGRTRTSSLFLTGDSHQDPHPWSDVLPTPWTLEVMKWFEGTVLLRRLNLRTEITGQVEKLSWEDGVAGLTSQRAPKSTPREYAELFCQSGLLLDSDYTNINFVGLLLTIATMIAINAASHWREHKLVVKKAVEVVDAAWETVLSFLRQSWTKLLSLVQGVILPLYRFLLSCRLLLNKTISGAPELADEQQGSQIDLVFRA